MGAEAKTRGRAKSLFAMAGMIAALFASGVRGQAQALGEALDAPDLVWTTGGDATWLVETTNTYDGLDAAQNGVVYSNQTSWIETTVVGPATIRFWVRPELNVSGGMQLTWRFTINDPGPPYPLTAARPPVQWYQQTYDLGDGTNVLRWTVNGLSTNPAAGFVALDEFAVSPPRPLTITYQPFDQTIYSGAQIGLYASAIGTPPIYYQWHKGGTNIPGATNSWFGFDSATTNDSGVYFVTVSNSQDQVVSSNAVITVLPPTAPFFTLEPADATVYTGQSFQWYANVSGSPPFTCTWWRSGTLAQTGTVEFGGYGSSLNLANVSESDAGNYWLLVTNDYGGVQSSNVTLTVIPSVAPVITRQPRSLEVAEGVNTWMTMAATGAPGPYYKWTGPDSPPQSPLFPPPPVVLGSDSTLHKFINATTNDAGIYFATVSNYAGETNSWEALLTVLPAITNVGSWDGDAVGIFVTNNLVFLARGTNGLAILDVSNPTAPQGLGAFKTNDYASRVVVSGDAAYVATGSSALQILSFTNPANPVLLGTYVTPGSANDVAVRSNLAYVAGGSAGLLILNVSNAMSPSVVGSFATNFSPNHICLSGNLAVLSAPQYIALNGTSPRYVAGLFVVDVSDPAHPFEAGRFPGTFGNIDVSGQCVFAIAAGSLEMISISDPAQPTVIGLFSYYSDNGFPFAGISATDVRTVNDHAFVTANSGGQSQLYVLDVRDPTTPIPVGYYTNSGQFSTLAVDGNRAFMAGYQAPLQIVGMPFDANPIASPTLSASAQAGMNIQIQGRHGSHYDVEYTPQLGDTPWQTLQTMLLTNDSSVISVPTSSPSGFFRLKQRD